MNPVARVHFYGIALVAVTGSLLSPFKLGVVCGDSMAPTFRSGQTYLLDRAHYRSHPVERGDVVVFRHDGENYVKRVVAVGGDAVYLMQQLDGGDDQLVFDWQLDGMRRIMQDPLRSKLLRLVERRVPEGTCYVVGDHMEVSQDSRHFGPVPLEQIQGQVLFAPQRQPALNHVALAHPGTGA
jgi:signal peptidase I